MSTKVWNLMYALGNTEKIVGDSENPQTRKRALEGAETITTNGWRVWVEHHVTGNRLYENPKEKLHQANKVAAAVIKFAEENVPGFVDRPRG